MRTDFPLYAYLLLLGLLPVEELAALVLFLPLILDRLQNLEFTDYLGVLVVYHHQVLFTLFCYLEGLLLRHDSEL